MNRKKNQDFNSLPIDMKLRENVLLHHGLQSFELMRIEHLFFKNLGGLDLMRNYMGPVWHRMTSRLLTHEFLEWNECKRLTVTPKGVRVIAAISEPVWMN